MARTDISSASDSRVDAFRSIKGRSGRLDPTFVAESELVLDRLIESHFVIRAVLLTAARAVRVEPLIERWSQQHHRSVEVFVGPQAVIDEVVGYPLHRGVVALAERPTTRSLSSVVEGARTVIVLEDVADPENVGSIFRHAAGFGVDAVVLHGHTGDPFYRKTIRTSMGWTLAIPFTTTSTSDGDLTAALHQLGFITLALTPEPSTPTLSDVVATFAADQRVALVLGAEGPGLTDATLLSASCCGRIPMSVGVDSLNVASAAAIALYALTTAQPHRLLRSSARSGTTLTSAQPSRLLRTEQGR
jgi:tRNA G18 (ribose-2'-O)-methylase SpoU